MKFIEGFEEIETMESEYGKVILNCNDIYIPFINVGISRHKLNPTNNIKYLNYSYIICENVIYIKKNNKLIYENDEFNFKKYGFVYLSGSNLYKPDGVNEITILCENKYLKTLDYSELRDDFWNIRDLNKSTLERHLNFDFFSAADVKIIPI